MSLSAATGIQWGSYVNGLGGTGVIYWSGAINSELAKTSLSYTGTVLINLGVNDITSGLPNQTTWQNGYLTIIDAVHARWPYASVYITKPWKQGFDSSSDTLAGWIDNVVAARSAFAAVGDDERTWFKPNVATYSPDGIHYNAAGEAAAAAAKKTAMGF